MILQLLKAFVAQIFIWFANIVGLLRNFLVAIIPISLTSTTSILTGVGGVIICSLYYTLKAEEKVSVAEILNSLESKNPGKQGNDIQLDGQFFKALFASLLIASLMVHGVPIVFSLIASLYQSILSGIITTYLLFMSFAGILALITSKINPASSEDITLGAPRAAQSAHAMTPHSQTRTLSLES